MKRFAYIVAVLTVCSLMVVYMLSLLVRNDEVQTSAVRWVAAELSQALDAEIDVKRVDYRFFHTLHIDSIYLSDRRGDTLAFISSMDVQIHPQALLDRRLVVKSVAIDAPYFNLHDHNYDFLVQALRPDKKKEKNDSLPVSVCVKDIHVTNLRMRYDTLLLVDAEARMALDNFDRGSIDARIHTLHGRIIHVRSFGKREKNLFELCNAEAEVHITPTSVDMPRLLVRLPHSELNSEVVHISREAFTLRLNDAYCSLRDIGLFVPQVRTMDGKLSLTAALTGNTDSIFLDELRVSYKDRQFFLGTATAFHWQNFDSLQLRAECQDLMLRAALLQDFIADLLDAPYRMPVQAFRLGEMHYTGVMEGRMRNMNLHGRFRTALGAITTNGHAQIGAKFDELTFNGSIATRRFRLGQMLDNKDLGTLTMNAYFNGHSANDQPARGLFRGDIQRLTYKGYTYSDIRLDGRFGDNSMEGSLSSHDPNINLSLDGLVDLSETAPNINVTLDLRHLRLDSLHLTDKLNESDLQMKLYVNFSGTHIDHLNGYLVLDSLMFANAGDTARMEQLKILAESDSDDPTHHNLKLQSDYAVGRFAGHFSYTELGTTVQKIAVHYMPHLFDARMREQLLRRPSTTKAAFYLYAHDLDRILDVMPTNISQSGSLTLKGMVDEQQRRLAVSGVIPELRLGRQEVSDIILSLDNKEDRLNFRASAEVDLPDTLGIGNANVLISASAWQDSVLLSLVLDNDAEELYGGQIGLLTTFSEYARRPVITTEILPSEMYVADSPWSIDEARMTYTVADTALLVEHLWIGNEEKHIYADGVASRHQEDSLSVRLQNIDLAGILGMTLLPEATLTAQGKITGEATLYGIMANLLMNANLHVENAGLNGYPIGDADAWAKFDAQRKAVEIGGEVHEGDRRVADVSGLITPTIDKSWELHIRPDSFNLGFVNHWTKSFLSDLEGRGTGVVHVLGRNKKVWVLAEAKPHNVGITVPVTGGRYYINDTIYMDSTAIRFPHHTAYDKEGHTVTLDGAVNHRNFRGFRFNLNIYADKAIVLDLPAANEASFYGKVYATGGVRITGDERQLNLKAQAHAGSGSVFHLNLFGVSTAKESSFITFVNHDEPAPVKIKGKRKSKRKQQTAMGIDLDMYINVDQSTQLVTHFGTNSDDILRGRGEGDMRVRLQNDDLSLQGTLTFRQGSLSYALGKMVHRDFSIVDGSTITWNGAPEDMDVNIAAKYHVVASLKDLFGSDLSSLQTNRTSVPVNCIIYMRDKLLNPVMSFGIELPQSDESVQSQVRSLINSDDMLMREVLYLLIFNRFFTPEYLRSTNTTGLNETYSLLSSTITGQINAWLSKLTNIVTFGINFRTDGEGADASQEYEAQFSIQPIERLLINGNVGYRYNDLNNRPVFGDLDIEYIITEDGKVRVKGFTHSVDKYSLRQANMVEGVGVVFKHDFNWGDAFRNAERRKQQKAAKSAEGK